MTSVINSSSVRLDSSKRHVAGREHEADVVGHPVVEQGADPLDDLGRGAGPDLDRRLHVGVDRPQRPLRVVALLLGQLQMVVAVGVAGAPDQALHAAPGDVARLVLGRRDRQQHAVADARLGIWTVEADSVILVSMPCLEVLLKSRLADLSGPHQAHPVTSRGQWAAGIPERDPLLQRLRRHRHRRKVEEAAVLAGDLAGAERALDDREHVGEPVPGFPPVLAEPVVLDRDRAAPDPVLEPAVR